jgi:hypothetical protein
MRIIPKLLDFLLPTAPLTDKGIEFFDHPLLIRIPELELRLLHERPVALYAVANSVRD